MQSHIIAWCNALALRDYKWLVAAWVGGELYIPQRWGLQVAAQYRMPNPLHKSNIRWSQVESVYLYVYLYDSL